MEISGAVSVLAALAQSTRLAAFRLLVTAEPEGLPAGKIAHIIGVPQNTMSSHLAALAHAGLVTGERQSRTITYRVNLVRFRELTEFLVKDCCSGHPEICAPLLASLAACCL